MKYLFILLSLFSVISCKSQFNLKSDQTVIEADPKMDWIFGKNYKNWTPSGNDIETAEKLLQKGFEDQKRGTVNRVLNKTPDNYYRQFIGAIDENGDKIIWINCFCKSEIDNFKEWKDKIVHVQDGGNCFINVTINITKNTYTSFMVNGDA